MNSNPQNGRFFVRFVFLFCLRMEDWLSLGDNGTSCTLRRGNKLWKRRDGWKCERGGRGGGVRRRRRRRRRRDVVGRGKLNFLNWETISGVFCFMIVPEVKWGKKCKWMEFNRKSKTNKGNILLYRHGRADWGVQPSTLFPHVLTYLHTHLRHSVCAF